MGSIALAQEYGSKVAEQAVALHETSSLPRYSRQSSTFAIVLDC